MCNEYFINITSFRLLNDQIVSVPFPTELSLQSRQNITIMNNTQKIAVGKSTKGFDFFFVR